MISDMLEVVKEGYNLTFKVLLISVQSRKKRNPFVCVSAAYGRTTSEYVAAKTKSLVKK